MGEDIRVRPEGCISESSSDISLNWKDMRNEFEYTTLSEMGFIEGNKNG